MTSVLCLLSSGEGWRLGSQKYGWIAHSESDAPQHNRMLTNEPDFISRTTMMSMIRVSAVFRMQQTTRAPSLHPEPDLGTSDGS